MCFCDVTDRSLKAGVCHHDRQPETPVECHFRCTVVAASLLSARGVVSVLTTHTHTRLQAQQTPEQTQVAYFLSVFLTWFLMALLLFADTHKHSTHTDAVFNEASL